MAESQDQDLKKLITGRQAQLESERTSFNDRMQDIADYVIPHRNDILGTLQKGEAKGTKIFDGTAVSAAVLATDGIHGYHVSPAFPWFKYQMNRKAANKIPEVREWLQEIEFNMYQALNRSNFYNEMWSYIYDGFTIGTAIIYPEEDLTRDRIVFETVHPGEIYIAENKYGEVDIVHRKRKLSARKLYQMFGEENVTDPVKTAYKDKPFQEFNVLHAVFPREEYDGRMKDGKNKKIASVWYLEDGDQIMKIHGFDRFPYHVWRYLKSGKESYGISPAMLAMSDIKGLNLMGKTILGAAQMAVDPPYNVPSYLQGKVQLKPRGKNYVEGQDKITPINSGLNFPVGIDREQAKQKAIKERFHVDMFLLLSQYEGRGERTAYEVSELMSEKAAVLGAELGAFNTQLDDMLDHIYQIEVDAGRMPDIPDILIQMAQDDPMLRFDPVYMGPLAMAQRERFSKDGLRKFFTEIASIVQFKQDAIDNIDVDEAIRVLGEADGIPQEILRDPDEVDSIRQGRIEAMQQQAQMENAERMTGMLETATKADANTGGQLSTALGGMMGGGAPAQA